jgi:ferredoxin
MPTLIVHTGADTRTIDAPAGARLRDVLLAAGLSPHGALTRHLNCGGRGLCATCGVCLGADAAKAPPEHWHDRVGDRFGYPRLSCQISIEADMSVHLLDDKLVWGRRNWTPEAP